jgi:hypothetical protein
LLGLGFGQMALITDLRIIARSLESRGDYANASVVENAVEVLKKQQTLLEAQEQDITELTIPNENTHARSRPHW